MSIQVNIWTMSKSNPLMYSSTATLYCCLGKSVESHILSSVQKDTHIINSTFLTQNWFYSFLCVTCKSRARKHKDMGRSVWAIGPSGRSVIKEDGWELFVLLFIFWHIFMPPNFRHLARANCPKFPYRQWTLTCFYWVLTKDLNCWFVMVLFALHCWKVGYKQINQAF